MPNAPGSSTPTQGVGGGVSVRFQSDPVLINLVVYGNDAVFGSGIGFSGTTGIIVDTVVVDNSIWAHSNGPTPYPLVLDGVEVYGGGRSSIAAIDTSVTEAEIYDTVVVNSLDIGIKAIGDLLLVNTIVAGSQKEGISRVFGMGELILLHATVWGNGGAGIRANGNVESYDSIIASGPGQAAIDCPSTAPKLTNTLIDSDLGTIFTGFCDETDTTGVIFGSAVLLNPSLGDFEPAPSSPAIDAGRQNDPISFDIFGAGRTDGDGDGVVRSDLGAIEAPAA
jgi:hypothetical protein